jgi:hypothetical protein
VRRHRKEQGNTQPERADAMNTHLADHLPMSDNKIGRSSEKCAPFVHCVNFVECVMQNNVETTQFSVTRLTPFGVLHKVKKCHNCIQSLLVKKMHDIKNVE